MAYTFRKYGGFNPNEVKCWSLTNQIKVDHFEIRETFARRGKSKIGTSIPSPMARMELFETAFQMVSSDNQATLKGSSTYHQLVSDCLDMMQLLFNTNESDIGPGKKIWFKEWRVQENLNKLSATAKNHPHQLLAKAFSLVFDGHSAQSEFAGTESIYLIYYENKLMGGTSPLTLFFTSPNWDRYVTDKQIAHLPKGNDGGTFFSDDYKALFERDRSFVEYLYKILLKNPKGFEKCMGLKQYINKTIENHFPDLQHKFMDWAKNETNNLNNEYLALKTNIGGKLLTVNGIYFYHQSEEVKRKKIRLVSDFVIRASNDKYANQKDKERNNVKVEPPLVLVDGMNLPGDYMEENAAWDSTTKIRYYLHQHTPLFERKLPQGDSLTVTYPFITTEDFLEDTLMEMPFKINKSKFFTSVNGDFKCLLPIKKEYFNFFNFDDLKRNLDIKIVNNDVTVTLKVPVNNKKGVSEIAFVKTYSPKQILKCKADIGIFPFYKINEIDPKYQFLNDFTVLLAERNDVLKLEALNFYTYDGVVYTDNNHADKIKASSTQRSTSADTEGTALATSRYYNLKESFDYLEIRYLNNQAEIGGIIIPNFEGRTYNKLNLNKAMTFAIDFGTSNTHIAFKQNNSSLPLPFEINEADQQMIMLNEPIESSDLGERYNNSFGSIPEAALTRNREFIPSIILKTNKNSTVSFPFKTATCEVSSFNNLDKEKAELFGHINIGFNIESEEQLASNSIYTTNLKWLLESNSDPTKNQSNKARVSFFIKQLLLHIKTKAILNFCHPDQLDVLWSIPSSMDKMTKAELEKIIKESYISIFPVSPPSKVQQLADPIKESVAPYFFLTKNDSGIQEGANVINVDIGGGTTDIMMFMESTGNRKDKYLTTSFRFAGSDIWGSGHKGSLKDNGFIKNYLQYKQANNIEGKAKLYLEKVQLDNNLSSDDLVSLLFRYDKSMKFSDSITSGNTNLSIVLYIHYSAIVYHICQVIESKKYPLPRYLSFTGKGSQYLKLLCNGSETELNNFTKLLFKAYSDQASQTSFRVHVNDDPKVITANGTIEYFQADIQDQFVEVPRGQTFESFDQDQRKKYQDFVYAGSSNDNVTSTKEFVVKDTKDLDSEINVAVLKNVNRFLELTLGNKQIIDFLYAFKIKDTKLVLDALKWNGDIFNGEGLIYDSYKKVLKDLQKQDGENQLSESLFFFAFKDSLYRLSKILTESNPS
ncbi:hypothetical protein ACFSR6_20705 [Pedobacter vanadiisoli]|uniref:Uncharacterized protein n=1 Tax=Pedobacter vanadiisoli TaxID=1761975 RepID=A0ABW5MNK6_9SPHI